MMRIMKIDELARSKHVAIPMYIKGYMCHLVQCINSITTHSGMCKLERNLCTLTKQIT